jgi:hypothetical protein
LVTIVLTAIGLGIIAIVLRDLFDTLFNPEGQGRIADLVISGVWMPMRRAARGIATYTGPAAYAAVIVTWLLMLVIGWALIYWPRMPDQFEFDPGLDPNARTALIDALYLSLVSLSTLGFGDITPGTGWLRLFAPVQALTGFLLLSAAITWILHIYEDLEIRRSLAHETVLLREALERTEIHPGELNRLAVERIVGDTTARIVRITGGLLQFPITYFFRSDDERESLELMSLFLLDIAEELARECYPPEVRLHAQMLVGAMDDLAEVVGVRFLGLDRDTSTREVLQRYAEEHRQVTGTGR